MTAMISMVAAASCVPTYSWSRFYDTEAERFIFASDDVDREKARGMWTDCEVVSTPPRNALRRTDYLRPDVYSNKRIGLKTYRSSVFLDCPVPGKDTQ